MNREEHLQYSKAVEFYLKGSSRRLRHVLSDKELSHCERKLIQVRLFMQTRRWKEAERTLNESIPTEPFLRAERSFLLANLAGYLSRWEDAIAYGLEAHQFYTTCHDRRGLYLTAYNLAVDFSTLGLEIVAKKFLDQATSLAIDNRERSPLLRARACSLSLQESYTEALTLIREAMAAWDELEPSECSALALVASDIHYRAGLKAESLEILKRLPLRKNLHDRGRLFFEMQLLKKMVSTPAPFLPIGSPPKDVVLAREYALKWTILHALQTGSRDRAEQAWHDLCADMPQIYGPNFTCVLKTEERTPFMEFVQALLKLSSRTERRDLPLKQKSKIALLIQLLQESGSPVCKEFLIEKIWETNYDPKMNARFYKLVERLRDKMGVTLKNKNGGYFLQSDKSEAS